MFTLDSQAGVRALVNSTRRGSNVSEGNPRWLGMTGAYGGEALRGEKPAGNVNGSQIMEDCGQGM